LLARPIASSAAEKSLLRIESGPQRLKPDLFSISSVQAKARTLQKPAFFRSLFSRLFDRLKLGLSIGLELLSHLELMRRPGGLPE
jgi:hypothetical protein